MAAAIAAAVAAGEWRAFAVAAGEWRAFAVVADPAVEVALTVIAPARRTVGAVEEAEADPRCGLLLFGCCFFRGMGRFKTSVGEVVGVPFLRRVVEGAKRRGGDGISRLHFLSAFGVTDVAARV